MSRQVRIHVCDSVQKRINRIHTLPNKGNEETKRMHTLLLDYIGDSWPRAFNDEGVFTNHITALKQGLTNRTERSHEVNEIIIENISDLLKSQQQDRKINQKDIEKATEIFISVANQLLA